MSIEIFEKSKICCICGQKDLVDKHYWVQHKITIRDFYEKYYPKTNLLTGAKLEFKSVESYISNDFADKTELREWIENNNKDVVLEYLTNWLKIRREIKDLTYTLDQFTSRSLLFPSISYIIKNYSLDTWVEINKRAGLEIKYDYESKLIIDNDKVLNFICDSREQKPLDLSNIQVKALPW